MKSALKILSVACCLALAGCMVMPDSRSEVVATDYGPPPPDNYADIVKYDMQSKSFETKTAIFDIKPPVKSYVSHSRFIDWPKYGWAVCGTSNRKPIPRAYNGYSGPIPFFVLFNNGRIIEKLVGDQPDVNGVPANEANMIIHTVCQGR